MPADERLGKPDAGNLHVRFERGKGHRYDAPALLDWLPPPHPKSPTSRGESDSTPSATRVISSVRQVHGVSHVASRLDVTIPSQKTGPKANPNRILGAGTLIDDYVIESCRSFLDCRVYWRPGRAATCSATRPELIQLSLSLTRTIPANARFA